MTRVGRPSHKLAEAQAGPSGYERLPHSTGRNPAPTSSGVLVLGDELHSGSIDSANTGNLPRSFRRFKRDDLKARLSA